MDRVKANRNALSLIFMIAVSFVSQIVGIMKSSVVAGTFGASEVMDAYNFANSIFSLIFGIIASGIPTVVLPAYVKKQDRKGIDAFITLIYGCLLIFIVLIMVFRYKIVYTFTNRSEMFVNVACHGILIMAFCQYMNSISSITMAFFQSKDRFNTPKLISLFSQIIVLVVLIYRNTNDIYEYIWIIAIGFVLNFILDVATAGVMGWRFCPKSIFGNNDAKSLLCIFTPTLFSSGIYQLSLFTDSMIASNLDEGKLTILNYSNMIVNIVSSLIIGNMLIYIYPKLIRKLSDGENQSYFWEQTTLFHLITCLLTVGFATVGKESIALLFQRGLFDAKTTNIVYICTLLYIGGLSFNIIRDMVYRYFYCLGNTKVPAQNSMVVSVSNLVISIVLSYFIGLYGIILGTVISSLISLSTIIIRFNKHQKLYYDFKIIVFRYFKNIIAGALTVCVVMFSKHIMPIDNHILSILTYGIETVLIYLGISFIINKKALSALNN